MPFDATDFEIDPRTLTTPRARVEYLRDFLRRLPEEQFDMCKASQRGDGRLGYCQSPACIGGWAVAIFRVRTDCIEEAGDVLGLDVRRTADLFYPGLTLQRMGDDGDPYDATPSDAADVLDHFLNTGEIDWSAARRGSASADLSSTVARPPTQTIWCEEPEFRLSKSTLQET